jgi:hypothetical protein
MGMETFPDLNIDLLGRAQLKLIYVVPSDFFLSSVTAVG